MKKKKVLAAAVAIMAAASMSATDVYAAKAEKNDKITFSGSTKTEYVTEKEGSDTETKWKTEVKLNTLVKADDRTNVMIGINYENKDYEHDRTEGTEIEFENLWVETKLTDKLMGRLGSQSLDIGKGLTIDCDGVMGAKFSWDLDKNNAFQLFAGRDGGSDVETVAPDEDPTSEKLNYVNYTHSFDKGNVGTYYMRQNWNTVDKTKYKVGQQKYWGLYSEYEVAPNVTLGAEYVRNSFTSKHGYVAELEVGNAKKIGDWKHTLTYISAPQYLYPNEDYTNYDDQVNKKGYKGIGVASMVRLTKASTVTLEHFWGDTDLEAGKDTGLSFTEVKLAVKF